VGSDLRSNPFVVLTAGRSGSSFLCRALQSHDEILCFGELLEEPNERSLSDKDVVLREKRADESCTRYCSEVVFNGFDSVAAVGFKIKYYHFERTHLAAYLRRINCRIIHNRRRNLLAQSLSLPLAEHHEFSAWLFDDESDGRYRHPITVNVEKVFERSQAIALGEQRFRQKFKGRLPVLDLFYEDFCESDAVGNLTRQGEIDRVLDFLGVARKRLTSDFAKQRRHPYDRLITNYGELRRAALRRGGRWATDFYALDEAAGAGQ
jgi:hypothetical protein